MRRRTGGSRKIGDGAGQVDATPAEVVAHLERFCGGRKHHFWKDSVTLIDSGIFSRELIGHHGLITDAYLLALTVRNGGRLATFDRSMAVKAVVGARPDHIELLGGYRLVWILPSATVIQKGSRMS